jgi:hypothetical protein
VFPLIVEVVGVAVATTVPVLHTAKVNAADRELPRGTAKAVDVVLLVSCTNWVRLAWVIDGVGLD